MRPDGKRDVLHDWKLQDTWKQMEVVLEKGQWTVSQAPRHVMDCARILIPYLGKVRSIGVSNFSEAKLEEILKTAEIIPAVNQANRL